MKSIFKVLLCVCALSVGSCQVLMEGTDHYSLHAKADKGDAAAQVAIGDDFRVGRYAVPQDYKEAVRG